MRLSRHKKYRFERGSILVTCMVLAAFGTIGVAAWISLLDARGHQVEQNLAALQRRATDNNSRALARLAIYRNHLHDDEGLAADTKYEIPGGLGSATIRSYAAVPLQNQAALRHANAGVVPVRSYATDVQVDLSDGVGTQTWQYQLKSYNPILGGDLLVMHPPVEPNDSSPLVSGNLTVKGRAVFWDAVVRDYTSGLRADEIHIPSGAGGTTTFPDSSGVSVAPLNYPRPRQTTGFAGAADPVDGGLDIVDSAANNHNAYAGKIGSGSSPMEVDGNYPFAEGDGPATLPTTQPNKDTSTMRKIDNVAASGNGKNGLYNKMRDDKYLSSSVLNHAVDTPTAFDPGKLFEIVNARYPLPQDVLTRIAAASATAFTDSEKDAIFIEHGVWIWSDGATKITVYLADPDLRHTRMTNVSALRLVGPADDAVATSVAGEPPAALLVVNPAETTLSTVRCEEQNLRRIVLAIDTDLASPPSTPDVLFTGNTPFPQWRMILEPQNTALAFDVSTVAGVDLIGGIRANRPISVSGGTLTLNREYEYEGLEQLLARNAWIESYRQ